LVGNGREALALATGEEFDLLLLDVHMPEIDGFQVIQEIRQRERVSGRHLPVIALTARSRPEDREHCLASGMDDFLTKPFHTPELLAAMSRLTRAIPAQSIVEPLLTPSVLLSACEGDPLLLEKLCGSFHQRGLEHLAALAEARTATDLKRLREIAHKLCGMLAAFSTPAGELASAMEDRADAGELEAALDLAAQVESVTKELLRQTESLTLDRLRSLAERE
jgi:CheY-like chemotaxis protein